MRLKSSVLPIKSTMLQLAYLRVGCSFTGQVTFLNLLEVKRKYSMSIKKEPIVIDLLLNTYDRNVFRKYNTLKHRRRP